MADTGLKPYVVVALPVRVEAEAIKVRFDWRHFRWEKSVTLRAEGTFGTGRTVDTLRESDTIVYTTEYKLD